MITPPPGVQVYLACGHTDMRKGMATLAMLVQQTLGHDPFSGAVYAFRGRRGERVTFYIPLVRHLADAWRHLADIVQRFLGVGF